MLIEIKSRHAALSILFFFHRVTRVYWPFFLKKKPIWISNQKRPSISCTRSANLMIGDSLLTYSRNKWERLFFIIFGKNIAEMTAIISPPRKNNLGFGSNIMCRHWWLCGLGREVEKDIYVLGWWDGTKSAAMCAKELSAGIWPEYDFLFAWRHGNNQTI